MVDDLLGFQMSSLQAGEPYEKCLHSVKNFVNTSVEGGPGKCLEACAFNPIDWKVRIISFNMETNVERQVAVN